MKDSITYFYETSTKIFAELIEKFYKDPSDIADFVKVIDDEIHKFGIMLVKETLEEIDDEIRRSGYRKQKWVIDKKFSRELVTSIGTVCYQRTHFRSKENRKDFIFLLDRIMGIDEREHFTEDAKARILEEAVETSYRKGGEAVNPSGDASRESVMNIIHGLEFPEDSWEKPEEKRKAEYIYIEADEDHVHLQYRERKGDIRRKGRYKNNTIEPKLIYVHEGIGKSAPGGKRNCLMNTHYFSRTTTGSDDTRKFWNEVYRYITDTYDMDYVRKIYLNSDGGGWIMMARRELHGLSHVLDEFHLEKCITKLTGHMKNSTDEAKKELRDAIRKGTEADFEDVTARLKECLPETRDADEFDRNVSYITNNWMAAKTRLCHSEGVVGSSTEGHVSHVLSSRMSTLPMGWSVIGAGNMCQLRAYSANNGSMLELVRYQKRKKTLPKAAGAEGDIALTLADIRASEKTAVTDIEKYYDTWNGTLSLEKAKQYWMQYHMWLM